MPPLFTIGVTTYNRHESLKETLLSITRQTFSDFEVIVGNDYAKEILSAELLGIADPRIRFVNHPKNLGELGNMNALLGMARGRYFTWQFDDDLYAPEFLAAAHAALVKFDFPKSVFTSYRIHYEILGRLSPSIAHLDRASSLSKRMRLLSGKQFLQAYLSGGLKAMGAAGIYDVDHLRQLGGVESLSPSPFALYSEYLLLVRTGLQARVAYINAPLVFFRVHAESWGSTSTDVDLHAQAGKALVQKSFRTLVDPSLREDLRKNLSAILQHVFSKYVERCAMLHGMSCARAAQAYRDSLNESIRVIQGAHTDTMCNVSARHAAFWFLVTFLETKFKGCAPPTLLKIAYKIYSGFWRRGLFASIP